MSATINQYIEELHFRMLKPDFDLNTELDYVFNSFDEQEQIVDRMLALDATINMGIDVKSSQADKERVKKDSRIIYRRLKKIDKQLGDLLIQHQDK
ncbi:MAG: hypothetical protein QNK68_06275 [Flavobacteriales bacterium]|jgi:hypothetical protein